MRVRESAVRDLARLCVWLPGRAAARVLPEAASLWAFERLADIHRALRPARGRDVAARIAELLGEGDGGEGANVARDYVRNHYVDRLHVLLYPRVVRAGVPPRWLTLRGREHLDGALAAGRGAVIVHPHYAVPQLLPLALGLSGIRCLQIGLPSADGLSAIGRAVAFGMRQRLEALLPARILAADGPLRPAFAWLAEGGVVLLTGDGTGGGRRQGRFEAVPFAGRRVLFPLGPGKLALQTGAPLLPAIVRRTGPRRYEAFVEPPFPTEGLDRASGPRILAQRFAAWFEARLRESPAPWHFWDEIGDGRILPP